MSKPIDLVAIFDVKPEHLDAVREAAAACALATRQEPGCLHYVPHLSKETPARLIFVEQFRDQAAIDFHGKTPHLQSLMAALEGKLSAEPQIVFIDPIV